ncbi:MAG: Fe-S cluster assembly sulfur transfer protein SufU [Candidatus Zhuqueibacterota bacterium]
MEFEDLYQEVILDHYRHPRNFGSTVAQCIRVEHDNPVCGDHIALMLVMNSDGILEDIKFEGAGCAISMASASMMTEAVKDKSADDVLAMIQKILQSLRGEIASDFLDEHGDLSALKGVVKFPVRVKCATLAWHALKDAISLKK